jgi:hypothetical protein
VRTHNRMQVGLHELLVEVNLVVVAVRLVDNVHVVQACDLAHPQRNVRGARSSRLTFLWPRKWWRSLSSALDGRSYVPAAGLRTLSPASTAWSRSSATSASSASAHTPCTLAAHLAVDVGDLLDRATLAGPAVPGGDDEPVRALAELLHELVLAVDGEGAVERLERVPLHLAVRRAKVKNSLGWGWGAVGGKRKGDTSPGWLSGAAVEVDGGHIDHRTSELRPLRALAATAGGERGDHLFQSTASASIRRSALRTWAE